MRDTPRKPRTERPTERPRLHAPPPPPPQMREPDPETDETPRGVAVIDFYV